MLTLTSPTLSQSIKQAVWSAIGKDARERATELKALCESCRELPYGDKRAGFERIAREAGINHKTGRPVISGERLRAVFGEYLKLGEVALIDHRLCGGRCMQSDCSNTARQRILPAELLAHFKKLVLTYRATTKNAGQLRTMKEAWSQIIADLKRGDEVPGVGTWRDVWISEHPAQRVRATCPYSESKPPRGWSYNNFILHKPSKGEILMGQKGLMSGRLTLPEVRLDYSTMLPQEWLVIDDKRLDFMVWGEFEGRVQICELWALFVMDVCTRRILWVQLFPKYERADGTKVGIQRRDVQHTFAQVFGTYGLPKDYVCRVIVENASAALTTECENLWKRIAPGRIEVKRSGLIDGKVLMGGFAEKGGSPHGKSWLESFFGNRLDIASSHIRGQVGSNYMLKPGDTEGRLLEARRILAKFGAAATVEQLGKLLPLESVQSVRPLILRVLHEIENRTDHALLGFQKETRWRWDEGDADWKAMGHPRMVSMLERSVHLANEVLRQPGCTQVIVESPAQKWQRLRHASDFERLSDDAFVDMYLDASQAEYSGNGTLTVCLKGGREYEFRGVQHSLAPGQMATVRFDADVPDRGAWLMDERGCYLGRMQFAERVMHNDREGLEQRLGEHRHAEKELIKGTRRVLESREDLQRKIFESEERAAIMTTVTATTEGLIQASTASRALAAAVAGDDLEALVLTESDREQVDTAPAMEAQAQGFRDETARNLAAATQTTKQVLPW